MSEHENNKQVTSKSTEQNKNIIRQMNLAQIIFYHFLPGISILLLSIVFANPDWGFGLPILLAIIIAASLSLTLVALLIIVLTAKRQKLRFKDMIPYRQKTPFKKLLLWVVACFIVGVLVFGGLSSVEYALWGDAFSFMPAWLRLDRYVTEDWDLGILRITAFANLIVIGLVGPTMEEVYFRGFLLPRMETLGKAAPLINATLFSVYHFFSPWELITRILACAPFAYAVWYKKDLRISIAVHCSMNMIGGITTLIAVFQM